jgi:hypothetical protein
MGWKETNNKTLIEKNKIPWYPKEEGLKIKPKGKKIK